MKHPDLRVHACTRVILGSSVSSFIYSLFRDMPGRDIFHRSQKVIAEITSFLGDKVSFFIKF